MDKTPSLAVPGIEPQRSEIGGYGRHESHADYMARLKHEHGRKSAFWSLLAD